ncbi:MAG TPA: TetR/AcrR family transcriptional regulator [Candidatus Krumholzibacteria bacterium]|nr:TetR/AcrR family transcriptional regulator [Candidatus Krumholzibacteria bacterium]
MPAPSKLSRRDQILEVALQHFSRHGYAGTSMRQLAEDVGITAAAIYRHFPSKLDLFEKAVESRSRGLAISSYLETLSSLESVEDILRATSLHLLSTAQQDPQLLRLLLMTSATDDEAAAKLLREFRMPYVNFLAKEFKKRIESGELRKVDPGITARCYVGLVIGCAVNAEFWNRLEDVTYETLDIICNNVPIFARGLLAEVPEESANQENNFAGRDVPKAES